MDFKTGCPRGVKPPLMPKPNLHELHAKKELTLCNSDPLSSQYEVRAICGTHSWIAIAYPHHIVCCRIKESLGWQRCYVSPRLPCPLTLLAISSKSQAEKFIAAALQDGCIRLWLINELGNDDLIGTFSLGKHSVDSLFFISGQLVGLSSHGLVGIWRNSLSPSWQVQQMMVEMTSYDTAGSILLLGCSNGTICCIDMQKFPLRMKDNDLLVTDLYRDPLGDTITAISVYLTPKSNMCGNWVEIAYGTASGHVRVIVQHPETIGHGPQLFQTFSVHRSPVSQVSLTTSHLISVCQDYNHVRTWSVTRFRGMINTQPGSTPLASFKVMTLEYISVCQDYNHVRTWSVTRFRGMINTQPGSTPLASFKVMTLEYISVCQDYNHVRTWSVTRFRGMINRQPGSTPLASFKVMTLESTDVDDWCGSSLDVGPYGEQDDEQVFVQKVVPHSSQLVVRLASTGLRLALLRKHECQQCQLAFSRIESSGALAHCLYEIRLV